MQKPIRDLGLRNRAAVGHLVDSRYSGGMCCHFYARASRDGLIGRAVSRG